MLDYVANTRVKTPTAAAEVLIGRMSDALQAVHLLGRDILDTVSDRLDGQHRQLAYYQGNLPALVRGIIERNRRRTGPEVAEAIETTARNILIRKADRLTALGEILDALSPEATLRRGYSITRHEGHAVTDASLLPEGARITTTFAKGTAESVVTKETM